MSRRHRWAWWLLPVVLLLGAGPSGAGVRAQADLTRVAYTATLHAGTCEQADLSTVVAQGDATLEAGAPEGYQSLVFALEVNVGLASLRAEPHALSVERVDHEVATVVACGDLMTGAEEDRLVLPLLLSDGTDAAAGMALVSADDDGSTRVVLLMTVAAGPGDAGDPVQPGTDAGDGEVPDDDDPEGGV